MFYQIYPWTRLAEESAEVTTKFSRAGASLAFAIKVFAFLKKKK